MNQGTCPHCSASASAYAQAPAGSALETMSSSSTAGPASTTTPAAINNNTNTAPTNTSRSSHRCGIDDCAFTSETAKGIREHQKNKHLGTECYWLRPDNEFCGYTTLSHEELYEHFNREHLRSAQQSGPPYQCCWPGNPGIPIPGGPPIPTENRCEQTFQHLGSADRHAREHQHKIWRAMDNVVWPVPRR